MIYEFFTQWHEKIVESNSGINLALLISLVGLTFSGFNFWYLMERKGKTVAYAPTSFGLYSSFQEGLILRLPVVFESTGAKPRIIRNLRLIIENHPEAGPIIWNSTRDDMFPSAEGRIKTPAAFVVAGRSAVEQLYEFKGEFLSLTTLAKNLNLKLEVIVGNKNEWRQILDFTLNTSQVKTPGNLLSYGNLN